MEATLTFRHRSPPISGKATSGLVMPRVTATSMQGQMGCDVISMCPPCPPTLLSPTQCQPTAERIRLDHQGHAGYGWTRLGGRRRGEEGDTHAQVSQMSALCFLILKTLGLCQCGCVCTHVFVSVLFMCSVFLGDCIFHSLCSAPGQQQRGGGCCKVNLGCCSLKYY